MTGDRAKSGEAGAQWPRRGNASEAAQDVYQNLLDTIGRTLVEGAFEEYLTHFTMPTRMETEDLSVSIASREDFYKMYKSVRDAFVSLNIPELTRDCTIAEFVGPHQIQGCHETRLITKDLVIQESYSALSTLVRGPHGWQVTHCQYIGASGNTLPQRMTRVLGRAASG